MPQATLCNAIATKNIVRIYYTGDEAIGFRTVEPHMIAYNEAGHLSLSAWCLGGASETPESQGWREYLLSEISNVTILSQKFSGPRSGYNPTGGEKFHNIQCAVCFL
jgi:predicted DNA-binding transcriptional regulator YafY